MKTFSKMRLWAFCLLAAGLFFAFSSCANGSGGDSGSDDSESVAVTSVELNKTSTSITVGGTETLTATVKPDNATDKSVTWTSSDSTVATVEKGVVTAVKAGEATITAKAGDKTATCAVTVTVPKIVDLSTLTQDTVVADGYTIIGTLSGNYKISIADGATVTLSGVSINADGALTTGDFAGLTCLGDATITLEEESTNTVTGFNIAYPGIYVPVGKTLTINGSGALAASPNTTNAGMSATGAGIGGGVGLSCGNITIEGGTITATAASHAAAIGSGGNYTGTQTCGNITITGGTVTATCLASYGAGIGAGINGECGNISITGGTVTASGASAGAGGAGIGCGGSNSTVGTITIADTVTKVTAVKGYNAQSIGKGFSDGTYVCGTITIGGTVYADGISDSPYTYPPEPPAGGINGLFSVSATKKVFFSKGNLRATYDGSSWTWSFADHQYDAVGDAVANTSINGNGIVSDNGSVDLFGWVGANSAFTDMAAFGISNSTTEGDYRTAEGAALNDWGTNAISNGGNVANYGWLTLTQVEWNYVLNTRAGADSKKGAATVDSVKGWILLPDAWTLPAGASFAAGAASGYTTNSYTAGQWAVMESAGAVFLPVTGRRVGSSMMDGTWPDKGYYWSATGSSTLSALDAEFTDSSFTADGRWSRYKAAAVRLAKDSE